MNPVQDEITPRAAGADLVFAPGGPMARLCLENDWEATPLGAPETWPQSLRTMAGTVVAQGIAQCICWGPDLLQIYNDAYREILGNKHPDALGRPVLWSWSEIRDEIAPLFERVLAGETVYFEDLHLVVQRHGEPEDAWFTFSYSPVRTESGEIGGVLVNCLDTSAQVRARSLRAEHDRLFQELQVERARLAFVFQQAPSFLAVLRGPKHVFELANEAYYRLVGHRDLVGKPLAEAIPEVHGQGFLELLDGVLNTGEPYVGREVPALLARTPGAPAEERYIDLTYMPLVEADGTRSGVIAHGTVVTEQVHARREVERLLKESKRERADAEAARAEAEAANRAKGDFLASMSHELRTPLNAIGGYVELLALGVHGSVTEGQRVALSRVTANQQHLLTLINDVLAFAKMEAGQIEFDVEDLGVAELLSGIEPLLAPLADVKEIVLSVEECDPALQVVCDEERVRQILLNLVGNAIKFTQAGGLVVLSAAREEEWAAIRVRDNGPGISPDKQVRIFDAFVQADRSLSNPQDGVGLGLAISRDLARAMGGELSLESAPGEGSTFTLRLPAG